MSKGGEFILPSGKLPDIFTSYDFSDEHRMFQASLRELIAKEVLPNNEKIESKDWELIKKLVLRFGEIGALGAEVPEAYGGLGLDKIYGAIVAEEVGWQASLTCTILAAKGIALLPILYFGNEEQKKRFLPGIVSGRTIGAYSLTESQAGSDAQALTAKAVLDEGGRWYTLNGEKMFVTNGGIADFFIVFARIEGHRNISAFIVERGFVGVEPGKEEHKLGILGSSTVPLKLTNVRVPVSNLLVDPNFDGIKIALNVLNVGRFNLAAACLGASKICFREAFKYSRERRQFKVPIGDFGAIRQKLCQISALIYGMESAVYRTAGYLDASISSVVSDDPKALMDAIREYAGECSLLKVFCSEVNYQIASENVQVHGGNGFMKDYSAERHLRDSVINRIFEGTNEVNRLTLTGEVLKTMFVSLLQEGKRIQSELMTFSPSFETNEDISSLLLSRLNGAKKALILSGGNVVQKLGNENLPQPGNQEALLIIADCLIDIYILESALSVYAKHRREQDEYKTRLLFHNMLPRIDSRTKSLIAMSSEGDERRMMFAALRKLFKYEPENIKFLHEKIEQSF